jgi:uncharacterized protein (TIGR03437 family)
MVLAGFISGSGTAHAAASPGLSIVSGNGQAVWESWRTTAPMVVQAIDSSGRPVANLPINWATTKGQGTFVSSENHTDANGYARTYYIGGPVPPGASFQSAQVTASSSLGSATFVITAVPKLLPSGTDGTIVDLPAFETLAPPADNPVLSGQAGATLAGAVAVRTIAVGGAQQGQPVPNVGLHLVDLENPQQASTAARCATQVLTDSNGVARCDVVLIGQPGTYTIAAMIGDYRRTAPITLTITPSPACTYRLSQTEQSVSAAGGSALVALYTAASCAWTASSNSNWITITSAVSGSGNGSIYYSVAPNTGPARTGVITAGGQTLTITQTGGGAPGLSFTTAATLPAATASAPYSVTLVAAGGQPPYTFSGTVPAGFSLSPTTGALTSASAPAGSYTFTITVKDAANATASRMFTLAVQAPGSGGSGPKITNTFPPGAVGQPYAQTFVRAGGCNNPFAPVTIQLASGSPPPGLQIDNSHIWGTPTTAGTFSFALQATDACGTAITNVTISISGGAGGGGLVPSPASVQFVTQPGVAPADQQVIINGPSGASWSASVQSASGGNWLSLASAGTGVAGAAVSLHANPGSLPPGAYDGALIITSASGTLTVPVKLTIAGVAALTADAQSIEFEQKLPAASPKIERTIQVSAGGANVHFVANATTPGGANWISVSPSQGDTPASITVTVDTTGIPQGVYQGYVNIAPANTVGPPLSIPVTLRVTAPAVLTSSAAKLQLSAPEGATDPLEQTISVSSSADPVTITATAATTSGGDWLSVTPTEGDTPANLTVSINPSGLAPGVYQGQVTIASPVDGATPITTLVSVTITQPKPAITTVGNGASFGAGPIAPGEVLVITGSRLGGNDLVGANLESDELPTELDGVKVYFSGYEAPLLYVSGSQLSVIVPYEIAGRDKTDLVIEYRGNRSDPITVDVADAAPGIFLSGEGVAAALNEDRTVNSAANGAAPGSVIVLYATGAGLTTPDSVTGARSTMPFDQLPKPKLPVTVTVDGRTADLQYSGAAPEMPAGVIQLNVVLPADLPHGEAVPVVLKIGDRESPAASIYIK